MPTRPIVLRGVRTRNLDGIDVAFQAGRWTSVVGVSGSGKTSLCFGTLHALSQQRFLSAMAPAARALIEELPQPRLDAVEGLCPTLALEQGFERPSRRSRAVELAGMELALRSLFTVCARAHSPHDGQELHCWTPADIVRSLLEEEPSARLQVLFPSGGRDASYWSARGFTRALVGEDTVELETVSDLPEQAWIVVDRLVAEGRHRSRLHEAAALSLAQGAGHMAVQVQGEVLRLLRFADHPWCPHTHRQAPRATLGLFSPNSPQGACPTCKGTGESPEGTCPDCQGSGLGEAARWYRLCGSSLPELLAGSFAGMGRWLEAGGLLEAMQETVRQTALELHRRLACLERLGTGYLQPGRRANTLSMGELHRLRLAHLTGGSLSGVCYVLDEPSTGLHPTDAQRLDGHLRSLAAQGNTLVVIDHRLRDLGGDRVLEIGPGSGEEGGRLVFDGSLEEFDRAQTPSARMRREPNRPARAEELVRLLRLEGASGRNLHQARLEVLVGGITGVCGPSGAGKSTLVMDTLVPALRRHLGMECEGLPSQGITGAEGIEAVEAIDPSDESVSNPRSLVATLAGILDPLRALMASTTLAKAQGLGPNRFSPNLKGGRCEPCQGLGRLRVELPYLPSSWTPCPHCRGARFAPETLEVRWRGLDLGQILSLTCAQALERFTVHPPLKAILEPLVEAGLGYLPLGFPSADLSGGEIARLRLCTPLARKAKPTLFVLDEPTRGLHPLDTGRLCGLLRSLVARGHSVLAISHDPAFLVACDRLCEIGPGAAEEGGRTLACGRVEDLVQAETPTAAALARELGGISF